MLCKKLTVGILPAVFLLLVYTDSTENKGLICAKTEKKSTCIYFVYSTIPNIQ